MSETYSITNLEKYAYILREGVANSFTENYTENLDDFISIAQVINLIKSKSDGKDENGQLIICQSAMDIIFDELREWIYGIGLSKLASRGYVDCAWDNEKNEMVFWLSDAHKTYISSKPTK